MANKYLLDIERAYRQGLQDGQEITAQYMVDCMLIALHDRFGFGAKRADEIVSAVQEIHDHFAGVFEPNPRRNPECDYQRSELDECLRRIYGDTDDKGRAATFKERCPIVKEVKYG